MHVLPSVSFPPPDLYQMPSPNAGHMPSPVGGRKTRNADRTERSCPREAPDPAHQPGGAPLPLISHGIGDVLGVARAWEPGQIHTEVPGEQRHILGRGQMGSPCGEERGHGAWRRGAFGVEEGPGRQSGAH